MIIKHLTVGKTEQTLRTTGPTLQSKDTSQQTTKSIDIKRNGGFPSNYLSNILSKIIFEEKQFSDNYFLFKSLCFQVFS